MPSSRAVVAVALQSGTPACVKLQLVEASQAGEVHPGGEQQQAVVVQVLGHDRVLAPGEVVHIAEILRVEHPVLVTRRPAHEERLALPLGLPPRPVQPHIDVTPGTVVFPENARHHRTEVGDGVLKEHAGIAVEHVAAGERAHAEVESGAFKFVVGHEVGAVDDAVGAELLQGVHPGEHAVPPLPTHAHLRGEVHARHGLRRLHGGAGVFLVVEKRLCARLPYERRLGGEGKGEEENKACPKHPKTSPTPPEEGLKQAQQPAVSFHIYYKCHYRLGTSPPLEGLGEAVELGEASCIFALVSSPSSCALRHISTAFSRSPHCSRMSP